MRLRLLLAAFVVCLCFASDQTYTVDQLTAFIRSSIQLKYSDKQIAAFLSKVKLSQSLDDRTIEDLQGNGLGPKTLQVLHELRDSSAGLSKPQPKIAKPAAPPIPPPSSEEQGRILEEVREYAMNYSKSLPDFICTQVVRRYYDPSGQESWRMEDTVTARLTYFEQKENYKLVMVNNQMTDRPYESLGGASSQGEFGSLLRASMEPKTHTRFEWDHWATLRGRRAYVFAYRVAQLNSEWHINWQREQDIVTGYHGLLYVDKATTTVLKITLEAEDIPAAFPVQEARTTLDYDFQRIGDRDYLLPLKAVVRMRHSHFLTKNEMEFRLYRKFSAEAAITFDTTPDALPDDKTKEQPPK